MGVHKFAFEGCECGLQPSFFYEFNKTLGLQIKGAPLLLPKPPLEEAESRSPTLLSLQAGAAVLTSGHLTRSKLDTVQKVTATRLLAMAPSSSCSCPFLQLLQVSLRSHWIELLFPAFHLTEI